jgi:hypothetical protein
MKYPVRGSIVGFIAGLLILLWPVCQALSQSPQESKPPAPASSTQDKTKAFDEKELEKESKKGGSSLIRVLTPKEAKAHREFHDQNKAMLEKRGHPGGRQRDPYQENPAWKKKMKELQERTIRHYEEAEKKKAMNQPEQPKSKNPGP